MTPANQARRHWRKHQLRARAGSPVFRNVFYGLTIQGRSRWPRNPPQWGHGVAWAMNFGTDAYGDYSRPEVE